MTKILKMISLLCFVLLLGCGERSNEVPIPESGESSLLERERLKELCLNADFSELSDEFKMACLALKGSGQTSTSKLNAIFERNGESRSSLVSLLAEDPSVNENLSPELSKLAELIINDFNDCGLSLNGGLCLDREIESRRELGEFENDEGLVIYAVELKYKQFAFPLVLKFELKDSLSRTLQAQSLELGVSGFSYNSELALDDFLRSDLFKVILTTKLKNQSRASNLSLDLSPFQNIRKLYHYLERIAGAGSFTNRKRIRLIRELNNKVRLISTSGNEVYQFLLLSAMKDIMRISDGPFLAICENLLPKNLSLPLRQYIATYLYQRNPGRKDLRPEVLLSLSHEYEPLRKDAVSILTRERLTPEELNMILPMMNDSQEDIRNIVKTWANNMPVELMDIKILAGLSKSNNWRVRQHVASLIGKRRGDAATTLIIALLADDEKDIRRLAKGLIQRREITAGMIPELEILINSDIVETRTSAARLLARSKSQEALGPLFARLAVEKKFFVKYEINKAIKSLKLYNHPVAGAL